MSIDYEAWRFWASIAQTLATVGIGIYVWLITKDRVTNKRITDLDNKVSRMIEAFKVAQSEKCTEHHQRTTVLETIIANIPTHDDLADLHEKVNKVAGAQSEITGTVKSINTSMRMLVEHHLKGGE